MPAAGQHQHRAERHRREARHRHGERRHPIARRQTRTTARAARPALPATPTPPPGVASRTQGQPARGGLGRVAGRARNDQHRRGGQQRPEASRPARRPSDARARAGRPTTRPRRPGRTARSKPPGRGSPGRTRSRRTTAPRRRRRTPSATSRWRWRSPGRPGSRPARGPRRPRTRPTPRAGAPRATRLTTGRRISTRRTNRPIAAITVTNITHRVTSSCGVVAVAEMFGTWNWGAGPGFGPTA